MPENISTPRTFMPSLFFHDITTASLTLFYMQCWECSVDWLPVLINLCQFHWSTAFLIRLHTVYCWFHAAVAGLSYSAHLQSIMPKSSSTWIFNKKDSKPVHQSGDTDFTLHRANVCRSVQWDGTTNNLGGIMSVAQSILKMTHSQASHLLTQRYK